MLSSLSVTAVTRGASGVSIQLLRSGKMPTKPTDRSEALDWTSVPVGTMVTTEMGGGVIPKGSPPVEVVIVLLTPGGCVVEPRTGSPLIVGPVPEMAVDKGVVSVALIDELSEELMKLETDVLEEVVVSLPNCTVDDPPSGSTLLLLLFAGTGNGAESCADASVPLVTCAEASKEHTNVKATVRLTKSNIIVMTGSDEREKEGY
jgi:hypothetical protein